MSKLLLGLILLSSFGVSAMYFTFSRDSRPVDGDFAVLTISGEGKKQDVLLTSSFYSWQTGEVLTNTVFDIRSMTCTDWYFNSRKNNVLHSIDCVRDDRPVDGVRHHLHIEKTEHGTFDVVINKSFYSRMTAEEIKESKVLTTNLILN